MSQSEIKSFAIETIPYQLILFKHDLGGNSHTDERGFDQFYKSRIIILDNNQIEILLGIQLRFKKENEASSSSENQNEVLNFDNYGVVGMVEAQGRFNIQGTLGTINSVQDFKLFPNMLAFLYPYVREKISYGFQLNSSNLYLPTLNFFEVVKTVLNNTQIEDLRTHESHV